MQTFRFDFEMRGRSGRCERCGSPLRIPWGSLCAVCAFGFGPKQADATLDTYAQAAAQLDMDAPLDPADGETPYTDAPLAQLPPGLPPLHLPRLEALDDAALDTIARRLADAMHTPAAREQAREARSLREQEEAATWARVEGDKPPFPLNPHCHYCCRIMSEYAGIRIQPWSDGDYCDAHSGSWRDFPPEGWDDRGSSGRPDGRAHG